MHRKKSVCRRVQQMQEGVFQIKLDIAACVAERVDSMRRCKNCITVVLPRSTRQQKFWPLVNMLRQKRKNQIQGAINEDTAPTRSKSNNDLLLQLGNKQYVRLQNRGKTTPAGRFYFSQTDTQPQTFDLIGNVIQRGSTEYLLTNGKLRVLRRLSGSDYIYTRLGTQYFSAKQASYLAHVPAVIKKGAQQQQRPTVYGATQRIYEH